MEKENIQQLDHQVVQHVQQEHMDQMMQMQNVQVVQQDLIHRQEQQNVQNVQIHAVENALHQPVNVHHVLQDMDSQVEHVQHVEVENIHLLDYQVVLIVQPFVEIINVLFQQENVMDVNPVIDTAMETVLNVDH